MNVIFGHEALGKERLDTMKIADGVTFVGLRLLKCSFRSRNRRFCDLDFIGRPGLIRQGALLTCVRHINAVDLRRDSTGFILNLAFELRLSSERVLQRIQIGSIINFVQQVTFFYEVVIVNR